MLLFEKGFNFSQDGPGNRFVYHLQGCNMRCKWCSNPEGMSVEPPMIAVSEGISEAYCNKGAIQKGTLNRKVCVSCNHRICIENKNSKIYLKAYEETVEEMLEEVLSSKPLFFGGGGVTLTGGEATLQYAEVMKLLKLLKEHNIHTAIETNASHKDLMALLPYIDYFIMDLKHYEEESHKEVTGITLTQILDNLEKIVHSGRQILLRIPLINEINTENPRGFVDLLKRYNKENLQVELLRYHEYGKDKWKMAGYEYTMENGHVSDETYRVFDRLFKENHINIVHT